LFAAVPDSKIRKWDGILRGAVYQGAGMHTVAGLSLATDALYLVSGLPTLLDHTRALRVEEAMATLNTEYPSSDTAWARMGGLLWSPEHPSPLASCRIARHVARAPAAEVYVTDALDRAPTPENLQRGCVSVSPGEAWRRGMGWRPYRRPTLLMKLPGGWFLTRENWERARRKLRLDMSVTQMAPPGRPEVFRLVARWCAQVRPALSQIPMRLPLELVGTIIWRNWWPTLRLW